MGGEDLHGLRPDGHIDQNHVFKLEGKSAMGTTKRRTTRPEPKQADKGLSKPKTGIEATERSVAIVKREGWGKKKEITTQSSCRAPANQHLNT